MANGSNLVSQPPSHGTSPSPHIAGRDLIVTLLAGFGLVFLAAALLRDWASAGLNAGGRINYLIALSAIWTLVWLGLIWFVFVKRRGMSFADLGYCVAPPAWAVRGVGLGFAALPAAFALYLLLRPILGAETSVDLREYFGGDAFTAVHAVTFLLYAGFLVPITEELLFRGLIFRWLRQHLAFWPSALIASVLFALAHQRLDQMIIVGLLGLPLAWLTEKSRSLVPAILMHQTYNSLTLMVTFAAVWFQPESPA